MHGEYVGFPRILHRRCNSSRMRIVALVRHEVHSVMFTELDKTIDLLRLSRVINTSIERRPSDFIRYTKQPRVSRQQAWSIALDVLITSHGSLYALRGEYSLSKTSVLEKTDIYFADTPWLSIVDYGKNARRSTNVDETSTHTRPDRYSLPIIHTEE